MFAPCVYWVIQTSAGVTRKRMYGYMGSCLLHARGLVSLQLLLQVSFLDTTAGSGCMFDMFDMRENAAGNALKCSGMRLEMRIAAMNQPKCNHCPISRSMGDPQVHYPAVLETLAKWHSFVISGCGKSYHRTEMHSHNSSSCGKAHCGSLLHTFDTLDSCVVVTRNSVAAIIQSFLLAPVRCACRKICWTGQRWRCPAPCGG